MCTRARESGSCQNTKFVYLDVIEEAVIGGLLDQLLHPDVITEAVREYHAEMRRLEGDRHRSRAGDERKLGELRRSIDRMIDAVASGDLSGAAIGRRLAEAEAEADVLDGRLKASAAPDVIALHPKALDYYLAAVTTLAETLATRQDHEAMKPIRELVDSIVVYPRQSREPLRFDIRGRLAALLNSADGNGPGPANGVGLMVPRDRIELPTRGFSIHCSTD